MNNKTKRIISWLFTGLVAFVFIASGLFKLFGGQRTAEMAKGVGGVSNLAVLGVLELIIAAIFLVPRTGIVGTLLAVAYIGGAMAVHFVNGQPLGIVIFIQVLIWVAAYVRFPQLRQRI